MCEKRQEEIYKIIDRITEKGDIIPVVVCNSENKILIESFLDPNKCEIIILNKEYEGLLATNKFLILPGKQEKLITFKVK